LRWLDQAGRQAGRQACDARGNDSKTREDKKLQDEQAKHVSPAEGGAFAWFVKRTTS